MERAGKLTKWDKTFTSGEKLEDVIQQIVGKCNRVVNESMPIVDARLDNGARVNAVIRPVALDGPILTIRRFPDTPITMEKLIALGSLPSECAEFLAALVRARYSMVIGGGTGSGKTTFLGALSNYIPPDERLITIEDNAELKIQGIANLVRLEAKMANMEGAASITIRDLIKTALRMRPDRIIVGEVRGGEAVDMLQALNTGHDGSLSTAHANSASDMLSRLETMTLMGVDLPLEAIRRQIASGVDILIHLGRMRDKSRKVLEITEICGFENHEIKTRTLYRWQEGKGLVQTAELLNREKLDTGRSDHMKQSYEEYRFSMTEILKYLVQGLFAVWWRWITFSIRISWLMFLALPVTVFFLKWKKKGLIRERKKNLNYQFKDALNALSVAVQAGYSVENAVMACSRDLERLYPQEADIVREFHYMETQLKVSVPVEELFMSFGDRSGIEDIENFAAVFYTAKRTGGDMNRIIQTSSRMLGDKIDVRREIETTLAAKKAEQMIMSLMPAGIILYLKMTSPGFLEVLYGNPFGILAMSLCLGIYGLSYWLGRRIVDIEV